MTRSPLAKQIIAAQNIARPDTPYAAGRADHLPFDHPLQWQKWPYALPEDRVPTEMGRWLLDQLSAAIPMSICRTNSNTHLLCWRLIWQPAGNLPRGGYFVASRSCAICYRHGMDTPYMNSGPFGSCPAPYGAHPATFLIDTLQAWLGHQRGHLATQASLITHLLSPERSRFARSRPDLEAATSRLDRVMRSNHPIYKRLSMIQFADEPSP